MDHEARMRLIHAPFFITYIGRSYPWAGLIIGDRFPTGRSGELLLEDDRVTGFQIVDEAEAVTSAMTALQEVE
jgi:hypothetical protein